MIGQLTGTVTHQDPSGSVVSVNGVGYLVHVAGPVETGRSVELWVTTVVREDAITLFGFLCRDDQAVFNALRAVSGVGPSIAVQLIRHLGSTGVAAAVTARDTKSLAAVRGVGAKVAERVVSMAKMPELSVTVVPLGDVTLTAIDTLVSLGFDHTQARAAVDKVGDLTLTEGSDPVAALVTAALGGGR